MDAIHKWIGLDKMAVENPLASVIVPTIRPQISSMFSGNTKGKIIPPKNWYMCFNGDTDDLPPIRPTGTISVF